MCNVATKIIKKFDDISREAFQIVVNSSEPGFLQDLQESRESVGGKTMLREHFKSSRIENRLRDCRRQFIVRPIGNRERDGMWGKFPPLRVESENFGQPPIMCPTQFMRRLRMNCSEPPHQFLRRFRKNWCGKIKQSRYHDIFHQTNSNSAKSSDN